MAIKKVVLILIAIFIVLIMSKPAFALDDGAYLAGRSTSYFNPLTNQAEDGGTNQALGDSMANNIITKQILIEKSGGKIYVTFGIGLTSNISKFSFKLMNSSGQFRNVNATQTGSSSANGDTVKHFRVQVNSLDEYISPVIFVDPMGRNVQFFIKIDSSSLTPGTGIYKSEMITSATRENKQPNREQSSNQPVNQPPQPTITPEITQPVEQKQQSLQQDQVQQNQTQENKSPVGQVSKESLFEGVNGLSSHVIGSDGKVDENKELTVKNLKANRNDETRQVKRNYLPWIIGGGLLVAIAIAGGVFYVKKVKK